MNATWLKFSPVVVILLGLLFGGVAGAGAYTVNYAGATSYLSDDPKACVNCHIMRDVYESWEKSSHHNVAKCVTCHLPHDFVGKWLAKGESGFNHSKAFTLQNFEEPIRIHPKDARIVEENCIGCHAGMASNVMQSHSVAQAKSGPNHNTGSSELIGCAKCHASVGHALRR